MKNKHIFYGQLDGRKRLIDLLPLEAPLSLNIDPCNECNFKCVFCPTAEKDLLRSVNRPQGKMSYELFCKVIDDVKQFKKKLVRLYLNKDGEPFLNKDLCKMIRYAKKQGVTNSVEVSTNASLIGGMIDEIIGSGLDRMRVSVEHINNAGYKNITRTFSDYSKIKDNITRLFKKRNGKPEIDIKILDVGLSKEEKDKFLSDFEPISDTIYVETLMGWSNTHLKNFTLGTVPKTAANSKTKLRKVKVCSRPFRTLTVNFNGWVSVCCVDWSLGTIVGDVNKESLADIWNGERLRRFRRSQLEKSRESMPVCADCHYVLGTDPNDDIDVKKARKIYL